MGLEKIVPTQEALGIFTRLLARSATGTTDNHLYIALS